MHVSNIYLRAPRIVSDTTKCYLVTLLPDYEPSHCAMVSAFIIEEYELFAMPMHVRSFKDDEIALIVPDSMHLEDNEFIDHFKGEISDKFRLKVSVAVIDRENMQLDMSEMMRQLFLFHIYASFLAFDTASENYFAFFRERDGDNGCRSVARRMEKDLFVTITFKGIIITDDRVERSSTGGEGNSTVGLKLTVETSVTRMRDVTFKDQEEDVFVVHRHTGEVMKLFPLSLTSASFASFTADTLLTTLGQQSYKRGYLQYTPNNIEDYKLMMRYSYGSANGTSNSKSYSDNDSNGNDSNDDTLEVVQVGAFNTSTPTRYPTFQLPDSISAVSSVLPSDVLPVSLLCGFTSLVEIPFRSRIQVNSTLQEVREVLSTIAINDGHLEVIKVASSSDTTTTSRKRKGDFEFVSGKDLLHIQREKDNSDGQEGEEGKERVALVSQGAKPTIVTGSTTKPTATKPAAKKPFIGTQKPSTSTVMKTNRKSTTTTKNTAAKRVVKGTARVSKSVAKTSSKAPAKKKAKEVEPPREQDSFDSMDSMSD